MVRVHNSQIRNEHYGSSICCSNKFQLVFHFSVQLMNVVYINSICYHLFLRSVKVNCNIDKLGVYAIIFHTIFSYQAMDSSWHITYTITDKQLQQF
uniref:Uncharacterized protein n=1 Tax=Gossypium raimondii TaxID=29730 RepID=A0A0D2TDG3_GOSRA|nr:hypothetical protein B456_009G049600 [Gossypium raimondii]